MLLEARKILEQLTRRVERPFDICSVQLGPLCPSPRGCGEYEEVFVAKDQESRKFLALVVPPKGAEVGWICDRITKDLKNCGIHGHAVLRTRTSHHATDGRGVSCSSWNENDC